MLIILVTNVIILLFKIQLDLPLQTNINLVRTTTLKVLEVSSQVYLI